MGESMAAEVLIIDDDTRLAAMLSDYLKSAGFSTRSAATGLSGLQEITRKAPDAVILDVMLPDHDGFEICRRIRASSSVPILMLTAKGEETDRIVGLELGADDYLPKPFSPRELAARLKAILRRTQGSTAMPPDDVLRFGRLEIDRGQRSVRLDSAERPLTGYQFALLVTMAENAGRVLSRERLMELTKGEELEAFDRSIDVHISRIRAAIEDDPKHPRRIITLRGSGYIFARNQDDQNR
jgi:DNA-binding response OmpR family regulator